MAEPPATSGSTSEPVEGITTPTVAAPEIGWLLKPGSSSIGLYIQVTANADELTPEVVRALEQLMSNAHGTSAHHTMMASRDCGSLKSCGGFSGACPHLERCSSY